MDSASDKATRQLPPEKRIVTQLNGYRPFTDRDLEVLASSNQVPSSIPKLNSGLISPVADLRSQNRRVEATNSRMQVGEDSKPIASDAI